jgi:hypothetical protein
MMTQFGLQGEPGESQQPLFLLAEFAVPAGVAIEQIAEAAKAYRGERAFHRFIGRRFVFIRPSEREPQQARREIGRAQDKCDGFALWQSDPAFAPRP